MNGSAIQYIDESEIHFVSRQPDHGRSIPHLPFFDGERLFVYAPHESGKLMVLHPSDSEHSHYVAGQPFGEHDRRDEFWDALVQRFTVPPLIQVANAVRSDVMNTLGSLQQYFVTLHYGNTYRGLSDTALMAMQLEYALTNHRSFYDLMNDIIINFRPKEFKKSATMARSFHDTVQYTDDELRTKFGVRECFIECARRHEEVFRAVRDVRDAVLHRGRSPALMIVRFDDGFGVGLDSEVVRGLARLQFWLLAAVRNEVALPLLPVFALLAQDVLDMANEIGRCMAAAPDAPHEIAAGYNVFFRSSLNVHATQLKMYLAEQWLTPSKALLFVPRESAG
jgi:hypothetical protein